MTEVGWRPSKTFLIAGSLVVGGFFLTALSWWFMLVVAAGTFGPGTLREFGLLKDKDEFETVAMYRAGYHAFLVSGLVAFATVAFVRSNEGALENPEELGTLFAAVLWCAWMFSTLFSVWGAVRAARRILIAFGIVWLIFNVMGSIETGFMAVLMQSLLALPFLAMAWACGRWPRVSGAILIGASVFFYFFFGGINRANFDLITTTVTYLLFIGPLLASGIALVFAHRGDE
jgi:hypothetical protein